ncbi:MAG: hypothetical protein Q4B63_08555 [Clostridium perfringens]|nr:hypothetical protein [Clostridium perfringens]
MYSNIELLNIAINFLPLGARIVSVNMINNSGMRGNSQGNLVTKYTHNNNDYTLILEKDNGYWTVKGVYNEFLERI